MAAFADSETQALFHGDRGDQRDLHVDVIAGHYHFRPFRQLYGARHVRRAEVELRAVAVEERRMTAAFFLLQYVDLTLEVRVRMHRPRFCQDLPAFDFLAVHTAQQGAHVVTGQRFVQGLPEHFQARDDRGLLLVLQADDFRRVAYVRRATFDTARCHGAAPRNREHVFHRHQERFVRRPFRSRNVVVDGIHQFQNLLLVFLVAFQRLQRGTDDDGDFVSRIAVAAQQVADFHLDQLNQFRIVHHVRLVQEYDHGGYPYLAGQQDVFTGLRHRAVSRRYDQDGAVHLRCAGDHVLDIVSMARAVDMGVMTLFRLVFDMRRVDRDATFPFFRRLVNHIVCHEFGVAPLCQHFRDGCGQGRFAVVDVADGADVDMRFRSFVMSLCHSLPFSLPPVS